MKENFWQSVVIPTFNSAVHLGATLSSIDGNLDGIEVIAVDDGSTDSTVEILESHSKRLNLKIIKLERHGNWVTSTNIGINKSRGRYISILHHDDVWEHNRLSFLKDSTSKFPDASMYINDTKYIDTNGRQVGSLRCPLPPNKSILIPADILGPLLIQNFISIPSLVFPRSLALRLGGLDDGLKYTADWDFCLKLASSGYTVYNSLPLSNFRVHGTSQTFQLSQRLSLFRDQLLIVFERHSDAVSKISDIPDLLKIGRASIDINVGLAGIANGYPSSMFSVIVPLINLGPRNILNYMYFSRIISRIFPRLKAGLLAR